MDLGGVVGQQKRLMISYRYVIPSGRRYVPYLEGLCGNVTRRGFANNVSSGYCSPSLKIYAIIQII